MRTWLYFQPIFDLEKMISQFWSDLLPTCYITGLVFFPPVPGGCQSLATSDFGQGTITVDATRPSTAARGGPKFAQTERLATSAAGGAMVKFLDSSFSFI